MRTVGILAADDELLARKRIERLVGALPGAALLGVFSSGEALLARLADAALPRPDLVLLDIHMPGLTGLDASALLPEGGPAVVFVTAHPEHALEAFGVGARDYLLKPLDPERLRITVARVRAQLAPAPGRIAVSTPRGVRLLQPAEISHATYDGTAVVIHAGGRPLYADGSLAELERRLDDRFVRVHRRALVNLDHVELLEPSDTGGLVARLSCGARVGISRQAARQLRRQLKL